MSHHIPQSSMSTISEGDNSSTSITTTAGTETDTGTGISPNTSASKNQRQKEKLKGNDTMNSSHWKGNPNSIIETNHLRNPSYSSTSTTMKDDSLSSLSNSK